MRTHMIFGMFGIATLVVALTLVGLGSASADEAFAGRDTVPLAQAATIVVTSTADNGPGTLRQALLDAASGDVIGFGTTVFPPDNPQTITLASALPDITQGNLTIDASNAGVVLDGSALAWGNGFTVVSDGNTIRGFQIQDFPHDGIKLEDGASFNTIGGDRTIGDGPSGEGNTIVGCVPHSGIAVYGADTSDNVLLGNYVGVDATGTVAIPNGRGINIRAPHNTVGSTVPSEHNVVSGNQDGGIWIETSDSQYDLIIGNYVGTDATGTSPLGNGWGVMISDYEGGPTFNSIGGSSATERNLISGNNGSGVDIQGSGTMSNTVSGNYIGTNISGTAAIANGGSGVYLGDGTSHNLIGGDTPGERNIISGNKYGITISDSDSRHNAISGNYIGTDATGTSAIPNSNDGVLISNEASYNLIGGDAAGERNVISANGRDGVLIWGGSNNAVRGNFIGTDANGGADLGNNWSGFTAASGASYNRVESNVISGNGDGIQFVHAGTVGNAVVGNYIGLDATGAVALGNGSWGVSIEGGSSYNLIGGSTTSEGNIIAYNGGVGVYIPGAATVRNTVTHNSIHSNTDKGIELTDGGNLELFPPIITDLLTDRVSGLAPPNSTVEIFSDDEDEGGVFEGSTTTDTTGHFTFNKPSGLTGPHTTATATDVDGNTSEFSTTYSVTHDMALVAIFSVKPRVQVGGAVTPTVEVGNAGSSIESNVPVRVRVTTDPGGTEVYSRIETVDSIGPLAYAFVTFEAWTPTAAGSYNVEASVMLPGDENGANDTKEVAVTAVAGNPEVYIKDNPQDDGSVPTSDYWMSPDIWVRHEEDGGEEHQQPIANQTNYAYARIHNIGDVTLNDVTVDLYWHEPALAIKCGSWRYIGQYTILSLAPDVTETIHLPWTPDVSGHTCLFAQIDSAQDPYARDHDCYEGVPWDNNLAQRNVEVVESAAAQVGAVSVAGIRLGVVNVRSKPASVDVVVEKMEAFTGTLTLDLGEELFNRWQNATAGTMEGGQVVSGATAVQITAPVSGTVVGLPLYGDEEVEVILEAEGQSGLEFEVRVVEWIDGLLIGGNTYQVKLPPYHIYQPIILKGHSGS